MRIRTAFRMGLVGLWMVGVGAASAEAATISSIDAFLLPGLSSGSATFSPPQSPNNDNVAAPSPNAITNVVSLNAGGFDFVDLEFNLTLSGGVTEYFYSGIVNNNTGVAWTDFHFQLGFGTGASFIPVPVGIGLDFDTPDGDPTPTSTVFPTLNYQPTLVEWSGAMVNYSGGPGPGPFSSAFTLSIDVPDGLQTVDPLGANRFTLRMFPTSTQTVPEPATAALVGVALAATALRRRRRK